MESKKNIRPPLSQVQIPLLESEEIAGTGKTKEEIRKLENREYLRRWHKNHPGYYKTPKQQLYRRKWHQEYYSDPVRRQKTRETHQAWLAKNPRREKRRNYFRMYDLKNKEKKRKQMRMRGRTVRLEAFVAYGGQICKCCGETIYELLGLDHINNDGKDHRKEVGASGTTFYYWLKKRGFPKVGLQVLCHNCNIAKALYGACPHGQFQTPIDVFLES
jgi:hypothetical protein